MKCPFCNQEMEQGKIHRTRSNPGLYYIANTEKGFYLADKIKISTAHWWQNYYVMADYCKTCKKIIIDVKE